MAKKKVFRKPRMTFLEKLTEKLQGFNKVNADRFSDGSGSWVEIKKDGLTLTISFDGKGENITDVSLHKDILDVVDQEKIWGLSKQ